MIVYTEPSSITLIEQSFVLFGLVSVEISEVRISEDPLFALILRQ